MRRLPLLAAAIGIILPPAMFQATSVWLEAAANKEVPSQSLFALELLQGLYPELLDKSLSLHLEGAPPSLQLRVAETGEPDPNHPILKITTPLFSASITLDRDSQVERLSAEGPFLQSQRRAAFDRVLQAHPDWSDDERAAELAAAGAEYGPGREPDIEAKVRPSALEKQVGRGVSIHIQGFTWKDPDSKDTKGKEAKGKAGPPVIGWRARLEASGPDGRPAQYELVVEPFKGRVISMTRLGRAGRLQ